MAVVSFTYLKDAWHARAERKAEDREKRTVLRELATDYGKIAEITGVESFSGKAHDYSLASRDGFYARRLRKTYDASKLKDENRKVKKQVKEAEGEITAHAILLAQDLLETSKDYAAGNTERREEMLAVYETLRRLHPEIAANTMQMIKNQERKKGLDTMRENGISNEALFGGTSRFVEDDEGSRALEWEFFGHKPIEFHNYSDANFSGLFKWMETGRGGPATCYYASDGGVADVPRVLKRKSKIMTELAGPIDEKREKIAEMIKIEAKKHRRGRSIEDSKLEDFADKVYEKMRKDGMIFSEAQMKRIARSEGRKAVVKYVWLPIAGAVGAAAAFGGALAGGYIATQQNGDDVPVPVDGTEFTVEVKKLDQPGGGIGVGYPEVVYNGTSKAWVNPNGEVDSYAFRTCSIQDGTNASLGSFIPKEYLNKGHECGGDEDSMVFLLGLNDQIPFGNKTLSGAEVYKYLAAPGTGFAKFKFQKQVSEEDIRFYSPSIKNPPVNSSTHLNIFGKITEMISVHDSGYTELKNDMLGVKEIEGFFNLTGRPTLRANDSGDSTILGKVGFPIITTINSKSYYTLEGWKLDGLIEEGKKYRVKGAISNVEFPPLLEAINTEVV